MKFLEWNNLLAEHFFNPANAGKDIHLFISKQEIINLAKVRCDYENDNEIWADFLRKLKNGLFYTSASTSRNFFDNALEIYQQWRKSGSKSIYGTTTEFPPYIPYLVFSVLPLIEIQGDYNANNYYDRLDDFLKKNNIQQSLKNKLKVIDNLWEDLSNWANIIRNGELGLFKIGSFSNSTWKYVGKPFSQCILPPRAIKNLPQFFYASGLIPKNFYDDNTFKQNLIKHGLSILGLKPGVIEIIKKPKDEIGFSIIETIKSEFIQWTGEEYEIILKDGKEKNIRKNTIVPLKLQFKLDEEERIDFSFRIKYSTEPPPNLKLGGLEDIYENENWSRTLRIQFSDTIELKDSYNKWIARFEYKNIRLFICGGYFLLGNDFWIETESLSRVEEMYLLCKDEVKESIKEWGVKNCSYFKDCSFYSNLPNGFSFFRLRNPKVSHSDYDVLRVSTTKKISLRVGTGLKIGYRTYLNELLPEVEISNADGNELVYMQYEDTEEKLPLEKHNSFESIWVLRNDILLGKKFFIQIGNESSQDNKQFLKIDEGSIENLSNDVLLVRNKYSSLTSETIDYIQGNHIETTGFKNDLKDVLSFNPITKTNIEQVSFHFNDSLLLKWLVGIKICDILKYNEAYETILHYIYEGEQHEVQQKKKSSINLLDYLGYVDYDYSTGKIFTLPPKLILIPSDQGRKALMIGARTEKQVNEMIEYCLNSNGKIAVKIKKQNSENQEMLIPDSIIFESDSNTEFAKLAASFRIEFDEWYILKLKNFIPTLKGYEQYVINTGALEAWEKFGLEIRLFQKKSLKFEYCSEYDKKYSLIECKPGYIAEYGLWIDNSYYKVDKNWGKYLFINFDSEIKDYRNGIFVAKPNVIFYNSNCVIIPASLPLPKYFSRIMIQLSGEAPDFQQLNLNGRTLWYNIYRNIPTLFSQPFFETILNMKIEKTNQIV